MDTLSLLACVRVNHILNDVLCRNEMAKHSDEEARANEARLIRGDFLEDWEDTSVRVNGIPGSVLGFERCIGHECLRIPSAYRGVSPILEPEPGVYERPFPARIAQKTQRMRGRLRRNFSNHLSPPVVVVVKIKRRFFSLLASTSPQPACGRKQDHCRARRPWSQSAAARPRRVSIAKPKRGRSAS